MTLLEKLISRGFDKKEAQAIIMAGKVMINNEIVIASSTKIKDSDLIKIKESKKYVSRGAYKLLEALNKFNIDVKNKTCLDVGSSTGGFTQVLIENDAEKIYALDSGTNQLDFKIRSNPKVITYENTNLKNIEESIFNEKIDFVCCDVSFISCKRLLDVLAKENILAKQNNIVILIKPQFESPSEFVEEGGYVNLKHHNSIINDVKNYSINLGFDFINVIESPITGNKSKNIEYLAWLRKGQNE